MNRIHIAVLRRVRDFFEACPYDAYNDSWHKETVEDFLQDLRLLDAEYCYRTYLDEINELEEQSWENDIN